ncbi:MAG TPA: hypothetical protein VE572_05295 [Nitrososphaeraceae archaeon]|nr:hypothetical protein [Nitrososphaeraceae archaeon]
MALYGIYGSHTTESCPLNNTQSRKIVSKMAADEDIDDIAIKNKTKFGAVPFSIGVESFSGRSIQKTPIW